METERKIVAYKNYYKDFMNTLTANEQKKVHYIFNAFQKKTQKTPESEIQQAIKLKNEYYESNA
jgi:hypothetical protein